tara:strand:- start:21 stop:905 length:885 start_codon:yes stop_codon:yes gene_type:complete
LEYKKSDTVFIFSQHRTGSTLLKNILNANNDVSMAFDEMNIFEPFRRNSLDKILKIKGLTGAMFISLIKQKKIYGTFWKEFEKSKINYKKLEIFFDKIKGDRLGPLLIYILNEIQIINSTRISGVKYPTHLRKMDFIFNTFKNSKNIFLTRNPLAIVASKINDSATQKRIIRFGIFGFIIRYITLSYFCIDYLNSYFVYKKNKSNLKIIFYEDLILNNSDTVKSLCDFLSIEFNEEMLKVTGKSSSYNIANEHGLHKFSLEKYHKALKPFEIRILLSITNRYYKFFLNELLINI